MSEDDPQKVREAVARIFSRPDGRKVLEAWERRTIHQRTPPDASEAQLRHMEGRRAFVQEIRDTVRTWQRPKG